MREELPYSPSLEVSACPSVGQSVGLLVCRLVTSCLSAYYERLCRLLGLVFFFFISDSLTHFAAPALMLTLRISIEESLWPLDVR